MAAIDKIYGTQEQYNELETWLKENNKDALDGLYPKKAFVQGYRGPISNFSREVDLYLLDKCPIKWVTDRIKYQHGILL